MRYTDLIVHSGLYNPKIEEIQIEDETEEDAAETGDEAISDGITMSYAFNGKPCTKEGLDNKI